MVEFFAKRRWLVKRFLSPISSPNSGIAAQEFGGCRLDGLNFTRTLRSRRGANGQRGKFVLIQTNASMVAVVGSQNPLERLVNASRNQAEKLTRLVDLPKKDTIETTTSETSAPTR